MTPLTVEQYCERSGIPEPTARRRLRENRLHALPGVVRAQRTHAGTRGTWLLWVDLAELESRQSAEAAS